MAVKSKLHKVVDTLGTLSLLATFGLGVYYVASGQSIDEDGVLVEEFWALGSAWLFMFAAIFFAMWGAVLRIRARKK